MAQLRMLLKRSYSGDSNSYSFDYGKQTITEVWYADSNCITADGLVLSDLEIGDVWTNQGTLQSSNYICTSLSLSDEHPVNLLLNGATYNVVTITAVFTQDLWFSLPSQVTSTDFVNWNCSYSSGGTKTFRVNSGAWYESAGVPLIDTDGFDFQVPIASMTLSANIKGDINGTKYDEMRGKVNKTTFRNHSVGSVMYDSYSAQLFYNANGTVWTHNLSLTFKILPNGYDWNHTWKNRMQAINVVDKQPLYWQNEFPNSADYTTDTTKVGKPIWSGEIAGTNAAYGQFGWDKVVTVDPNTSTITDNDYIYPYAELNDLLRRT